MPVSNGETPKIPGCRYLPKNAAATSSREKPQDHKKATYVT
jgi:hypothetical protein